MQPLIGGIGREIVTADTEPTVESRDMTVADTIARFRLKAEFIFILLSLVSVLTLLRFDVSIKCCF